MKSVVLLVLFAEVAHALNSHVTCSRNYVKIGCYNDKTKPLPIQLITDRDSKSPNYQGHQIDWQNWGAYIHSLACRCAAKAKAKNYKVFGLQNYGECWSGPGAEKDYQRDGVSTSCYTNPCNVANPLECVGMGGSNYIYKIEDNPCQSNPCKNGGTCLRETNGFHCHCPPNYGGTTCEEDIDECFLINLCENGGVCVNTHGGFECKCQQGFKGKYCNERCSTAVVDLCIVVDSSGSIGNNNYMAIRRTLLMLVGKLGVSSSKTHVGMINYSDKPHIHGKLNDPTLYHEIMLKLNVLKLPFLDGETRTDLALKMADKEIFSPGGGDRASVPNVLMVITDGKKDKWSPLIKDAVKPLKDKGVHIIAVGVDKAADPKILEEIALHKNNVIIDDNIEKIPLDRLLKAIQNAC